MTSWDEVAAEVPELANKVRERFEATKHKTMATLRKDGSPRISGTETAFADGELTFGSMAGAVKLADLQLVIDSWHPGIGYRRRQRT